MDQFPCRSQKIITGIIACLLLAGVPAAMAADDTGRSASIGGTIIARSYPSGAAIYLNDEYRGVTPAILKNVTPGEYLVNITLAGYNNESWTTILYDGSVRELGANLEPASAAPAPTGSGSIAIDSSPGGASVLIDGKPAGTTPGGRAALILNSIPAGSHTVTVELAGYPSHTETVTVIKNQVVKVNADFVTQSPTIAETAVTITPIATTDRQKTVPLSPLTVIAAAGLAGLVVVLRRS
jgi:hypothetical protein